MMLKGRRTLLLVFVLLIASIVAIPRIPDKWWDRQRTILTYDQDGSAMSRIDNWKVAWRVVQTYPLTGAGFAYMSDEMFAKIAPEYLARYGKAYNTHSIYFAILASHGVPAFIIFMTMIGLTMLSCRRIRRQVRARPDLRWAATYCDIVEVSLLAFLVNGAVNNMEYFDLPYHLVGLIASLSVICDRALAESKETVEVPGDFSPVPAS
jgi:probable O-glycosylation ligase (exosortase A-associated)